MKYPTLRLASLFFGLGLLLFGLFGVWRVADQLRWSSVPATVITSEHGSDNHPAFVVAQYRLGKAIYHCGKVFHGKEKGDAAHFTVGMKTKVYYDPKQPGQCALRRGVPALSLAFILLGFAFLGVSNYARRKMRSAPPKSA